MELTEDFIKFLHDQSAYGKIQVDTLIHELKKTNCYGSQLNTIICGLSVVATDNEHNPWDTDNIEFFALNCSVEQANYFYAHEVILTSEDIQYKVEDAFNDPTNPLLLVRKL